MSTEHRADWRDRLHTIIFEADTPAGKLFDIGLLIAILTSVILICLETVSSIPDEYEALFFYGEWTFTILFTLEYVLRLISVRRPWSYVFSFYGIVDLVSFLPSYFIPAARGGSSFVVVRSFRLLRVFRIMKLIHMTSESEDLAGAVWRARSKIVVFLSVVMITVTIAGTIMFEVENFGTSHDEIASNVDNPPTQFTSIPQSIYWAVVTMTTVGYGDIVPQTALGKIVSALLILVGYSLIIVPTGFVSAELIESRAMARKSTQACPYCMAEGHLNDAVYCRQCGKPL